jgi:GTP-binding protein
MNESPEVHPELRNIAVIAHVDHGKTTLVDHLLKQAGVFRANEQVRDCVMDSEDLERERGITILAKNCALRWNGIKINVIDTPGHADFGGEVERVLRMADGALLLVDSAEGVLPQTKFVLRKAFLHGLRPIVVLNKIDRPDARPDEVLNQVFDLFVSLGATAEQLDFPFLYAAGRDGRAHRQLNDDNRDFKPLFETIVAHVPPPRGDRNKPLKMQTANIDYDDFVGRIAVGRIMQGVLRRGAVYTLIGQDGSRRTERVVAVRVFEGLRRVDVETAEAGDIVLLSGFEEVRIGDTICEDENDTSLSPVPIDEPTITLRFHANNSPFSGREGRYVTSRQLKDRLDRESRRNVALRIAPVREEGFGADAYDVAGRGLLHLSVLIENMRREGFELQIGKPHVIFHRENDQLLEPFETAHVDVPEEFLGKTMELFGARRFTAVLVEAHGGRRRVEFRGPSRGLIGLRNRLMTATRGEAVLHHAFCEFAPFAGPLPERVNGSLLAVETGKATAYALMNLQDRGSFFVEPSEEIYEGQVVGVHCKENDLTVNVAKAKHLTNIRNSNKEQTEKLNSKLVLTLEEALEFIAEDELVEAAPKSIRMRKKMLSEKDRTRLARSNAKVENKA